jgi:hypothetical protein
MIRLLGLVLALVLFTSSVEAAHWSYPKGSVYTHLRLDHGINAQGMSYQQAEALHDSLHEGRRQSRPAMQTPVFRGRVFRVFRRR